MGAEDNVRRTVLDRIDDHTWPPGTPLPTMADIADELGVTRHTVRRALAALGHQGWLTSHQGVRWHVADPLPGTVPHSAAATLADHEQRITSLEADRHRHRRR